MIDDGSHASFIYECQPRGQGGFFYLMRYIRSFFYLFVISSMLSSCEKEDEKDSTVTAIHLDVANIAVNAGDEYQFVVTHEPADASTPSYKWSFSPQETGVTISETGLFKAIKPGDFNIKVITTDITNPMTGSPFVATCDVIVKPVFATQIKLSSDSIPIELDKDTLLSYTIEPEYASVLDIKWKSSNENVATVNNGRIEAIHVGKSIITAYSSKDTMVKADCIFNVLAPPLDSISIIKKRIFSGVRINERLNVTYYPAKAEIPKLIWNSSDSNVAVVTSDGTITTKGIGSCTIMVTTEDRKYSAACEIEVLAVNVSGMYFVGDKKIEVSIGKSKYLMNYIHFEPENATNINFASEQLSGFDVASLTFDGKVKGIKEGTATFLVRSEDGGYTDVCTVKVIDEVAKNVDVVITLENYAIIGGFTTANMRCSVMNFNEDPILVTGLDVRPSAGGGNSISASFAYHGYVNYLKSKYWLNSFSNIYKPYYLLYFQYNNKMYTKRID